MILFYFCQTISRIKHTHYSVKIFGGQYIPECMNTKQLLSGVGGYLGLYESVSETTSRYDGILSKTLNLTQAVKFSALNCRVGHTATTKRGGIKSG